MIIVKENISKECWLWKQNLRSLCVYVTLGQILHQTHFAD